MKAVVFIDVQKDFIDGALRNEKAIEVTPKIVEFAKECVEKGYKLYTTRDTHEKTVYDNCTVPKAAFNPELPLTGYMTSLEGQKLPVEHCVEGADGWMIDDRLMEVLDGMCTFVNKPTFGSFDLAEIIAEDFENKELNEIVLCGFVTDICCISNALLLRAKFPNTKITVYQDLCAGTTDENHDAALKVMKSCQIDIV
jgi:nicotinamidase-related amidase